MINTVKELDSKTYQEIFNLLERDNYFGGLIADEEIGAEDLTESFIDETINSIWGRLISYLDDGYSLYSAYMELMH